MGDILFGSSDKATTEQATTLTPEQKALLDQIIQSISSGITSGPPSGLGASNIELSSLASLENLVNQVPGAETPSGKAATNTSIDALGSLSDIFGGGPQDINDFFTQTVEKPLLKQFSEDTIPGIRTRFAPQFFGGERIDAENRAQEDLIDALTRERSAISFGARESDLNRKVNAASVFPGVGETAANLPFAGASNSVGILSQLLGAGGVPSQIEQRQLDERNRRLKEAFTALGIPGFENITTVEQGSSGILGPALGALGTAFGGPLGGFAGASLFGGSNKKSSGFVF